MRPPWQPKFLWEQLTSSCSDKLTSSPVAIACAPSIAPVLEKAQQLPVREKQEKRMDHRNTPKWFDNLTNSSFVMHLSLAFLLACRLV
jgi:hypothetical protein